jgi:hypothetical protein
VYDEGILYQDRQLSSDVFSANAKQMAAYDKGYIEAVLLFLLNPVIGSVEDD